MSPLGLALCSLATLVAIPVLFLTGGTSSVDIDASELTAASTASMNGAPTTEGARGTATANSLLDTVNGQNLLDGGADPDAALEAQHGVSSTSIVDSSRQLLASAASAAASPSSTGLGAPIGNESRATVSAAPPLGTNAPPATAAPATAAPTTAAPSTAAPTTPPSTAAPSTTTPAAAPTEAENPPSTADDEASEVASDAADAPVEATPEPQPVASSPAGPSAEDWAALRQCESFGDYGIVSANGLYYGAYQFAIATWNATADAAGRPDLVGVLPSEASPADQDALAYTLWTLRGWAPWPHCGRGLG